MLPRLPPSLHRGAVSQFAPRRRGAACVAVLGVLCSVAADLSWGQWGKKAVSKAGRRPSPYCGAERWGEVSLDDLSLEMKEDLGGDRKLPHGGGQTRAGTMQRMDSLPYHRCSKIFMSLSNGTEKQHYICHRLSPVRPELMETHWVPDGSAQRHRAGSAFVLPLSYSALLWYWKMLIILS